jgi:hypothetical protein
MKPLEKDELYQHIHGFLKNRGVELKEGGYSQTIQKSCSLLSDAINVGQEGLARAKVEVDKKLDQLRQVIHEKTAPPGSASAKSSTAGSARSASESGPGTNSSGKTTSKKRQPAKKAKRRKSA